MSIIPDLRVVAIQVAGFILILAVFKLFLFKPILGILDARRRELESQYESVEAARRAAEEMKSQYEQHLAGVQDEIRSKITEAMKEGQAIRQEILEESRANADAILQKAQHEIRREKDKAFAQLKEAVANIAVEAAGRLIEERMDDQKHIELVRKYIDRLDEVAR